MLSTKPSLTIVRRLKAPPAKVYAAWTDPEQLLRWFGPGSGVALRAEADARVGGRYDIVFRSGDGEQHNCHGEYLEVVPDETLVMTWEWITTPERRSRLRLDFKAIDGGTELTLTHDQFFDEAARDSHREGWTDVLDTLETYLAPGGDGR